MTKKKKVKKVVANKVILEKELTPLVVKIDKLGIIFGSEDMNKVVEKINEIIEKKCQ